MEKLFEGVDNSAESLDFSNSSMLMSARLCFDADRRIIPEVDETCQGRSS